jgi:hypothetical protein
MTNPETPAMNQVAEALRDMFALISEGLLVRDVSNGGRPDYGPRVVKFALRLAKAHKALEDYDKRTVAKP